MIVIIRSVVDPNGGVNRSGRPKRASQFASSEPLVAEDGSVSCSWSYDQADAWTAFVSADDADALAKALGGDAQATWLGDQPPRPAEEPLDPKAELLKARQKRAEQEAKQAETDAEEAARKAEQDRREAMTQEERDAEDAAAEEAALLAELAQEEAREAARQERLAKAQAIRRRQAEEADKVVTPEQLAAKEAAAAVEGNDPS